MKNKFLKAVFCVLSLLTVASLGACEWFSEGGTQSQPSLSLSGTDTPSSVSQTEESSSTILESVDEETSEFDSVDSSTPSDEEVEPPAPESSDDKSEENPEEKPEDKPEENPSTTPSEGIPDEEKPTVNFNLQSPLPQTQYGYQSLKKERNGEGLTAFYEDLYELAASFHNSRANAVVTDGESAMTGVDYGRYGISDEQAIAVWKVFGDENPIFYWLDRICNYGGDEFYMYVDPVYAKYTARAAANSAIKDMLMECDGYLQDTTSDLERALTIYDFLIEKIDYAYESDGVTVVEDSWAYNIAGGATKGYGVCECYAETYAYICNLYGIECLNVVGYAGDAGDEQNFGGHAWNYLCLNEKWYAVDITWADIGAFDRWYFGTPLEDYKATHKEDLPTANWGIEYQCALPELSDGLSPVLLGEEGKAARLVASIDDAFKCMTNEGGRYEITLYPHTSVSKNSKIDVYNYGDYFESKTLPKAAHITFVGSYEYGFEYAAYYPSQIDVIESVTLQCDITLKDVYVYLYTDETGKEEVWVKNGYTVTQIDSQER